MQTVVTESMMITDEALEKSRLDTHIYSIKEHLASNDLILCVH